MSDAGGLSSALVDSNSQAEGVAMIGCYSEELHLQTGPGRARAVPLEVPDSQ